MQDYYNFPQANPSGKTILQLLLYHGDSSRFRQTRFRIELARVRIVLGDGLE